MKLRTAFLVVVASVTLSRGSHAQQCTVGTPAKFEPPAGVYPGKFQPGFANALSVYGPPGARKLLMRQNYGYSIFSLNNPFFPAIENYLDIEQTLPKAGDGFETVLGVAGAPDGSRAIVGYKQTPNGTLLMKPQGSGFTYAGDFSPTRPLGGAAILQQGSRYLGFSLPNTALGVADITTFGTGTTARSIASEIVGTLPGGRQLQVAGNHVVYQSGTEVVVVDATVIGPVGSLSADFKVHRHTLASLGLTGNAVSSVTAAVHPATGFLYLVVEGKQGSETTGVALLRSTDGGATLSRIGSVFVPPAPYGGSGSSTPGVAMLVPANGSLLAFFWAYAAGLNRLFTMYDTAWGTNLTPNAIFDSRSFNGQFPSPTAMQGFADGTEVYAYFTTGVAAFALPVGCPAAPPARTSLYTVTPCRAIDTRTSTPLQPAEIREVTLSGSCGIQATDVSISLNVTALNATSAGSLTVFAAGLPVPAVETMSFSPGRTLAAPAIVSPSVVGGQARVKIRNGSAGTVDVLLDVTGVFR